VTAPRQKLIADLVDDLEPVTHPGRVTRPAGLWLLAATSWAFAITLVTGPFRPGALQDLASHAPYLVETGLAVLAITALAFAALRSAIPGEPRTALLLRWLLPVVAWVSVYIVGLWYPPDYVAPFGGRYQCPLQVVLFSLPACALLLRAARRQFPLRHRMTGFLCGSAAAAIPAALMQFACVYTPAHVLSHHIAPVAVTAVLGGLLGPRVLRSKPRLRRPRNASLH
jgi:hypothetical protein